MGRLLRRAIEEQLVDEALAASAAMHDQVFELFQPLQVPLELRVAPARVMPRTSRREKRNSPRSICCRSHFAHHLVDHQQQLARLRGHRRRASGQHLMDDLLRQFHVGLGRLDVLEGLAATASPVCTRAATDAAERWLDQRQVLGVIAPRARQLSGKLSSGASSLTTWTGPQEPLRVAMQLAASRCGPCGATGPRASATRVVSGGWPGSAPRSSLTVSTMQRFNSSSSISIAVVVRKIITGPSTRIRA